MVFKLKKEFMLFILIMVLSLYLLTPKAFASVFEEFKTESLWNKITGYQAASQSLGVSVRTNALPIIGNVTFDEATPISVTENGNKTLRFSFIATDNDGLANIVNNSAIANISRTGETTRHNDSYIDSTLSGCQAVNNVGTNSKNFTCSINIVFYDGAGSWNIAVRINDSNRASGQNTTQTFTVNELTSIQLAPNSISFPTVGLLDINISASINLTVSNTGNDDLSGLETSREAINITAITLIGETNPATVIPTGNFSIGTLLDVGPTPAYCDISRNINTTRLINTTSGVGVTLAYNNFSGTINGSSIVAAANVNTEVLSFCLLDVPDDLTAQNYSTLRSASWTVSVW